MTIIWQIRAVSFRKEDFFTLHGIYMDRRYHRSGSHDGAVADGYAWGDCCVCPDPHILADHDRGRIGVLAALWIYLVVKSRQYDVVANKSAVSSRNAALVLKVAACAEKYILPFSTSQIKNVFHSCG